MKTKQRKYKTKVVVPEKPADEDITTLIARLEEQVRKLAKVQIHDVPDMTEDEIRRFLEKENG